MIPILLLIAGGLTLTVGDLVMKEWVINGGPKIYCIGMVIYLFGMNFLAQSFRFKGIAVATALFVIFNLISLAVAGYLLYGEKLSSGQFLGIVLAVVAIVLLELG